MKPISPTPVKQRGAALAIGLILLAVASLVTVTSINTGVMQERMSANQDNHARAFMAAEAGGARLVERIRAGWPTANTHPLPGTHRLIANDPSITFTLLLHAPSTSWAVRPLNVLIEGHARSPDGITVLARTQLLVSLEPDPPAGATSCAAQAAISCFRGPCQITAGSGGGGNVGFGSISGFNHPIPPMPCSGSGCRMQPQGVDRLRVPPVPPPAPPSPLLTAMPAVFLEVLAGSSIGGGKSDTFQGLNDDGNGIVTGNGNNVARTPAHYPVPGGPSTAPTWATACGGEMEVPTTTRLESGRSTLRDLRGSDEEVGTLVINGDHLEMQGNALFVGLIVIRNCGTLSMGGNPNIYGAVIVDARRANGTACPNNYNPFGGSGTPAVRYSLAALQRAANPPGSGTGSATGVNVLRWTEFLP